MKINKKMHIRKKGPGAGKVRKNPARRLPGRWKKLGSNLRVKELSKTKSAIQYKNERPIIVEIITERVKGGRADGLPDKLFHKKDLKQGMKVESEHTPNPSIQKEITKDHMVETGIIKKGKIKSKYYHELHKLEKKLER